jgi:hypothetical protein
MPPPRVVAGAAAACGFCFGVMCSSAYARHGHLPDDLANSLFAGLVMAGLCWVASWVGVRQDREQGERALRRRQGQCERCGYDLRGHASGHTSGQVSGVCPECGAARGVA